VGGGWVNLVRNTTSKLELGVSTANDISTFIEWGISLDLSFVCTQIRAK
jgi:hypothetical protein